MFRTFEVHPGGPIGAAILLVRGSAALTLLSFAGVSAERSMVFSVLVCTVVAMLLLGIGTKFVTSVAAGGALVTAWESDWTSAAVHVALAIEVLAIFLTGPGAFSLDALRFGRTTLRIEDRSRPKV
jgi:uncharacterized membrane protein YphA (DoxX/SURF4 family)